MRELDIQEATTFPASPFALEAQLNDEILLGGFSPSKFTEHDFLPAAGFIAGQGAPHSVVRIEAMPKRA